MDSDDIRAVETEEALDEVLSLPRAMLYKHSTRCGTSVRALLEVERFARTNADVPVYGIDVNRQREISRQAASRLEVEHESPQIILTRQGKQIWSASHYRITAEALAAAIAEEVND
ncbi:MAG: bacillithiol system redox-active protein YtxJ [Gemmatimonadetes bacterium]|nr:bacillithiol system redox-active protein YtxJ [Gemmatimonadota bacterium]NNK49300.1 bacillithiol system redox-active protein YtxJ [Gemmatimonadota bacterium]